MLALSSIIDTRTYTYHRLITETGPRPTFGLIARNRWQQMSPLRNHYHENGNARLGCGGINAGDRIFSQK